MIITVPAHTGSSWAYWQPLAFSQWQGALHSQEQSLLTSSCFLIVAHSTLTGRRGWRACIRAKRKSTLPTVEICGGLLILTKLSLQLSLHHLVVITLNMLCAFTCSRGPCHVCPHCNYPCASTCSLQRGNVIPMCFCLGSQYFSTLLNS